MDRTALKNAKYRYIYGPVPSWRLGSSLGIDPVSQRSKECSFDCVYCQLGRTRKLVKKRKVFVPSEMIAAEIKRLPPVKIDYITFSGRGEPTLAKNLGDMIEKVKKIREEPVAVLTNSSMLCRKEVRRALSKADMVVAKLDAPSEELFRKINGPAAGIYLKDIIKSIKDFKAGYKGKLALQIMFIEENRPGASSLARIASDIGADEVQLNTPLRPCGVKPLSRKKMHEIERHFKGMNTVSVYKSARKKVAPISGKDTLRRRGKV